MARDCNASVPALKGMGFQPVVERILEYMESGKLTNEDLDRYLMPQDRDLLEQRIAATLWYPIDCMERFMYLLRDFEGGEGEEYFIQFGEGSAAEMLGATGVKVLLKGAKSFGPRAGIALIKLSQLFFNFSKWEWIGDDIENFEIRVTGATPLPEPTRLTTLGLISHLARHFNGRPIQVVSERPSRDLVIYRTV